MSVSSMDLDGAVVSDDEDDFDDDDFDVPPPSFLHPRTTSTPLSC